MYSGEHIIESVAHLNEAELRQVAEFLSFLKFRSRIRANPFPEPTQLGALYAEFSEEDSSLAEQGMADYIEGLEAEDNQ